MKYELDAQRLIGTSLSMRFESNTESGRVTQFEFRDDHGQSWLTLRTDEGAFDRAVTGFDEEAAPSKNAFDDDSVTRPAMAYAADELAIILNACELGHWQPTLAAWRKLATVWSPPSTQDIVEALNQVFESEKETFWIPGASESGPSFSSFAQGNWINTDNAGLVLALCRPFVPRDGPLQSLLNTLVLASAADSRMPATFVRHDLRQLLNSADAGPFALWLASHIAPSNDAALRTSLARRGFERNTAEGFALDLAQVLASDSYLSRLLLSIATAVGQLGEAEIKALAGPPPDQSSTHAITDALLLLHRHRSQPLEVTLRQILVQIWQSRLKEALDGALKQFLPQAQPAGPRELPFTPVRTT